MPEMTLNERMLGLTPGDLVAVFSLLFTDDRDVRQMVHEMVASLEADEKNNIVLSPEVCALLELVSVRGAALALQEVPSAKERQELRAQLAARLPRVAAFISQR